MLISSVAVIVSMVYRFSPVLYDSNTIHHTVVAAGENVASFQAEMCQLWKKFLLNQFHDVIPGSCIAQVVTDALELYKGSLLKWHEPHPEIRTPRIIRTLCSLPHCSINVYPDISTPLLSSHFLYRS